MKLRRPRLDWGFVAVFFVASVARARAEVPSPPAIESVRYTEDYGYLSSRDPAALEQLSPWGRLKYIVLNEAGDVYLTLGAELRLRYEWYENNNWGEGPQDGDGYLWTRALPLADLHVGDHFRFFGQLISAFVFDLNQPKSPVDEDRFDVLQAFGEARLPFDTDDADAGLLVLSVGRQLLKYGSGRLIDVRYGPNVLQTFDTAKMSVEINRLRIDAFYAHPVDHRDDELDDETDDRQSLWALYGTLNPARGPTGFDLYYIGYENEDAVFGNAAGREMRHTLGSRVFGGAKHWDWDFELFCQFGDFETAGADGNISAWSVASNTGYTFANVPLRPRAALKANVISGDDDPGTQEVESFNPLFPKGKYFGELTPIGPVNLIHINPYVTLHLLDGLALTANVASYWRESDDDGVYALGGTEILRADSDSDARYIGTQAELLLELEMGRHVSMSASYALFTAGEFIEESGAGETIHFVGLEAMYRL